MASANGLRSWGRGGVIGFALALVVACGGGAGDDAERLSATGRSESGDVAALVRELKGLRNPADYGSLSGWGLRGVTFEAVTVSGSPTLQVEPEPEPVYESPGVTAPGQEARILVVPVEVDAKPAELRVDLGHLGEIDQIVALWPRPGERIGVLLDNGELMGSWMGHDLLFEDGDGRAWLVHGSMDFVVHDGQTFDEAARAIERDLMDAHQP